MRRPTLIPLLAGLLLAPLFTRAQTVWFKTAGGKEEKIELQDPFAEKPENDPRKGVWKDRGVTYTNDDGVEITRKIQDIVRFQWKEDPAPLVEARNNVVRGQQAAALAPVERVLRKFDRVKKVPGSLWLKAAEVKLDALSGLSNTAQLGAFIAVLEENDDGSVPGLANKIKLAKLYQRVRAEDHLSVITEAERLMGELDEPDARARLLIYKADSTLALRRYEDALNIYLRIPVFYGSEKAYLPAAYLGAAKALRALDSPSTREQNLNIVSADYLRQIIREFPVSKEAGIAREMLPREERLAEEKRLAGETDAAPPAPDAKPAEAKPAETPAEK